MGFNKRWVVLDRCIDALKEGKLKQYYGKSDMLHFEDDTSVLIHDLYCQGKSDEEILIIFYCKMTDSFTFLFFFDPNVNYNSKLYELSCDEYLLYKLVLSVKIESSEIFLDDIRF